MQIQKLYVYPIKSLRGVEIDHTTLTKFGFPYDRMFMILQVNDENGNRTLKNMSVANYNEMVRFFPEIDTNKGSITVTFKPTDGGESKSIEVPLEQDTSDLEVLDIEMHKSPTKAFNMGSKYNDWLTSCFGYECILAFIGENMREVRMSALGYNSLGTNTNGTQADGSHPSPLSLPKPLEW